MRVYFAVIAAWQGTPAPVTSNTGEERWFFAQAWFWACLIFLVFAVGVWLLMRFRSFLKSEGRELAAAQDKLNELYLQNKEWDEESGDLILDGVERRSLAARIVELAHKMRKRGFSLDAQETRNLVEGEIYRRMTGPRYVAGSLILFGLMGTLVGLSYTVKQLAAAAQQVEANLGGAGEANGAHPRYSSEQAVRNLLGPWQNGMNNAATAFFASLSGVSGTVLFLLMLSHTQKRALQLSSQFRTFMLADLAPFMAPPEKQQSFERIAAQLGQSSEMLRKLGESISAQVEAVGRDMHMAEIVLRNCDAREARFLEEMQGVSSIQRQSADRLIALAESSQGLHESSTEALKVFKSTLERFETESTSANVTLNLVLKRAEESYLQAKNFYQQDPGFSWSELANGSRDQSEQLRQISDWLEEIRDENVQLQQSFAGIREVFQQQLEQRDLTNAALNRLPEESFWPLLKEQMSVLPSAAAKMEEGMQQLAGAVALLQKMLAEKEQAEARQAKVSGNGEVPALQSAVVAAAEKSATSRDQQFMAGNGKSSGENGVVDHEALRQFLAEQLQLQNEMLSYNRKIFLLLSRAHVFKSATRRFVDFWFGQRRGE